MDLTIIQQGRFTSSGNAEILQIRSDVDWMYVINQTVAAGAQTTAVGAEWRWFRGMAQGSAFEWKKSNAANAANLVTYNATGGFTLIDSSNTAPFALTAVTSVSNANPPVVTVASTASLVDGDIVRMIDITGGQQLGGIDYTINVTGGTTFTLENMPAIASATTGFYRKIPFDPIFYPSTRFISKISKAVNAIVTLTVTNNYKVGQQVRFLVPPEYGMTELTGLTGNIVAIGQADTDGVTNTITVDIDTTTFTTFAFPVTADTPFSPAITIPVGENTSVALAQGVDILTDATVNTAYIGMSLAAGLDSPAGAQNDVIYWIAGKSFSVDNQ